MNMKQRHDRFMRSTKACTLNNFSTNTKHGQILFELHNMYTLLCVSCESSIMFAFLFVLQGQFRNTSVVILLLLLLKVAGDIESNPGPLMHDFHEKIITIFHLNTRSVRNELDLIIICFY